MTIWKAINGYEGLYEVSNTGQVRSLDRIDCAGRRLKGKILNQIKTRGYYTVTLCKDGKPKQVRVNRLVLMTFCPIENPDDYDCDHIDFDITNNQIENLRWLTKSENSQRTRKVKPVKCVETGVIYNSVRAAERETKCSSSGISKACKGIYLTCGGFHWEYVEVI